MPYFHPETMGAAMDDAMRATEALVFGERGRPRTAPHMTLTR